MTRQDRTLHRQCSASLLLGFYGGKGACLLASHVSALHAYTTDTSDSHRINGAKKSSCDLRRTHKMDKLSLRGSVPARVQSPPIGASNREPP